MPRPGRTRLGFVLNRLLYPTDFCYLTVWRLLGWPRQSWAEIQQVKAALLEQPAPRVFEWGLGASTLWYTHWLASQGRDYRWYGVDHDRVWHAYVVARADSERVSVTCAPFEDWTMDDATQRYVSTPAHDAYIEAPLRLGGTFDLLVIDGRFRRRCVDVAMQVVRPGGLVLLSEAQRTFYHCSLAQYPGQFVAAGHTPGILEGTPLTWIARGPSVKSKTKSSM